METKVVGVRQARLESDLVLVRGHPHTAGQSIGTNRSSYCKTIQTGKRDYPAWPRLIPTGTDAGNATCMCRSKTSRENHTSCQKKKVRKKRGVCTRLSPCIPSPLIYRPHAHDPALLSVKSCRDTSNKRTRVVVTSTYGLLASCLPRGSRGCLGEGKQVLLHPNDANNNPS